MKSLKRILAVLAVLIPGVMVLGHGPGAGPAATWSRPCRLC